MAGRPPMKITKPTEVRPGSYIPAPNPRTPSGKPLPPETYKSPQQLELERKK